MYEEDTTTEEFDFEAHARTSAEAYRKVQQNYLQIAETVKHVLEESLRASEVAIHSIQARAKEMESFYRKVNQPSGSDPKVPKYPEPLKQITDLAGVRAIAFFPKTLTDIDHYVVCYLV